MAGDTEVKVQSMYGRNSRQPLVTLQWGDRAPFQFPPAKAREIALMLLEAAESAEQDGFIVEFFGKQGFGLSEQDVGRLLLGFRDWRREAGGAMMVSDAAYIRELEERVAALERLLSQPDAMLGEGISRVMGMQRAICTALEALNRACEDEAINHNPHLGAAIRALEGG